MTGVRLHRLTDYCPRRLRRLTILLFLLVAPAAHAAPLVERPFEPLPNRGPAACLRATGTPGGLALFGPLSRRSGATDLLTATAGGTTSVARVISAVTIDCAATATAGGAAVVAVPVVRPRGSRDDEVRAVVRDAGGAFGAQAHLGDIDLTRPAVTAAVSPGGQAVVAWAQRRGSATSAKARFRIVAARRAPGGDFGPFERLTTWRGGGAFGGVQVTAAIDAAGVATVAWTRPTVQGGRVDPGAFSVESATGAPGARFTGQRIASGALNAATVALAVAPGGWALLAYGSSTGVHAFERAPGASRFSAAFSGGPAGGGPAEQHSPAVAIGDSGGGLVAWRAGIEPKTAGVAATTRAAAGAFAPPRTLAAEVDTDAQPSIAPALFGSLPPVDPGNATLRAALATDGRALLAWTAKRPSFGGTLTPRVAAGSLGSGFGPPAHVGSPVRDVNGVAPLFLADGTAALAWTDNVGGAFPEDVPGGTGRLHLATESAAALPEPELPRIRIRAARTQRLRPSGPVRLSVSCDRACDLRAVVKQGGDTVTRTLLHAGTVRLTPDPDPPRHARRYRVRVVVRAAAPGGHATVVAATRVRVFVRRS
jgi:hypothetical protein